MEGFNSLKEEGNTFYKKCADGYPKSLWPGALTSAIEKYEKALSLSKTSDQKSSLLKNLGMANSKMLEVVKKSEEYHFYTFESLKKYNLAIRFSEDKKDDWRNYIHVQSKDLVQNLLKLVDDESRSVRIDLCYKLRNQCLELELAKLEANFILANLLFLEGVELTEKKEYKKALSNFENFSEPSIITKSLAKKFKNSDYAEDIEDLSDRCLIHLHRAQAMREKDIGKKMVEDLLNDEEDLSIELVWQAVDQFTYAIKMCKGVDIELEAELNSSLGNVFGKILKLEDRAIKYYEASLALANTLVPRVMTTVEWYKRALDFLKEIQERKAQQEEKDFEKLKQKYQQELQPLCTEINQKSTSLETKEFLAYLYGKFPPKNNLNASLDSSLNLKKQVQNALIHYHPDKNQNEDEKWIVLVNEITVYLNSHYYKFK